MDAGESRVTFEIRVSNKPWDRDRDRAEFIGTGIGHFINQLVLKEHRRYLVALLRLRLHLMEEHDRL